MEEKTARILRPLIVLIIGSVFGFLVARYYYAGSLHSFSTDAHQRTLDDTSSAIKINPEIAANSQGPIQEQALGKGDSVFGNAEANGYLARLELHSPQDIERALQRAELLHQQLQRGNRIAPLAMVIHGPEVAVFFSENYPQYKRIVDLAARLSAFNVVDLKVCQTQIDHLTKEKPTLPPFVEEVPYGPGEVKRLIESEGFVYF